MSIIMINIILKLPFIRQIELCAYYMFKFTNVNFNFADVNGKCHSNWDGYLSNWYGPE